MLMREAAHACPRPPSRDRRKRPSVNLRVDLGRIEGRVSQDGSDPLEPDSSIKEGDRHGVAEQVAPRAPARRHRIVRPPGPTIPEIDADSIGWIGACVERNTHGEVWPGLSVLRGTRGSRRQRPAGGATSRRVAPYPRREGDPHASRERPGSASRRRLRAARGGRAAAAPRGRADREWFWRRRLRSRARRRPQRCGWAASQGATGRRVALLSTEGDGTLPLRGRESDVRAGSADDRCAVRDASTRTCISRTALRTLRASSRAGWRPSRCEHLALQGRTRRGPPSTASRRGARASTPRRAGRGAVRCITCSRRNEATIAQEIDEVQSVCPPGEPDVVRASTIARIEAPHCIVIERGPCEAFRATPFHERFTVAKDVFD